MMIASEFFYRVVTSLVLIGGLILFLFILPPIYFSVLLGVAALYMYLVEWPQLQNKCPVPWILTGLIYPVFPCLILIYLNQYFHPQSSLIFIWTPLFDTTSYLAGKRWGKTPIAPSISPGKTVEGFLSGLLAVVISLNVYAFIRTASSLEGVIAVSVVGILLSVAALAGDLFESWIKRKAGVKDSGNLLPGHGGLLDRMDGMLATGMLVFFIYMIF